MALTASTETTAAVSQDLVDTALSDTLVQNAFGSATRPSAFWIDNSAVAAAVHFQAFDDDDPILGSTKPTLVVKVPASTAVLVQINGDDIPLYTNGVSWGLTDDPFGATLTGVDRNLFVTTNGTATT